MRRARRAVQEDGRFPAAAALPTAATSAPDLEPWKKACMSLLLLDEQWFAMTACDVSRKRETEVVAWHPSYERAPRPIAGSESCLLYDVRGAQALALMVYDWAISIAVTSMRVDCLTPCPEMQRRACRAFSYAWAPEESESPVGSRTGGRAGLDFAAWMIARQQEADEAMMASAASKIARKWRARQGTE